MMTSARITSSGAYSRRTLRDPASGVAPLRRGRPSRRPPGVSRRLAPSDVRGSCPARPVVRLRSRVPTDVPVDAFDLNLGGRGRSPRRAPAASPSGVPMTSPLPFRLGPGGGVSAMDCGAGPSGRDERRTGAVGSDAGPGAVGSDAGLGAVGSDAGLRIAASAAGLGGRALIAGPGGETSIVGVEGRALVTGLTGGTRSSGSAVRAVAWSGSAAGERRRRRGGGPPVEAARAASVSASSSGVRWGALNPPRLSPCDAIAR